MENAVNIYMIRATFLLLCCYFREWSDDPSQWIMGRRFLLPFHKGWSSVSSAKGSADASFLSIWRIWTALTYYDSHRDTSGSESYQTVSNYGRGLKSLGKNKSGHIFFSRILRKKVRFLPFFSNLFFQTFSQIFVIFHCTPVGGGNAPFCCLTTTNT